MEGVRLYTSADEGAPVINGTDKGGLVRLLHACLVTGYGVKTAAGWTREWVKADESKAAFRNIAGSGRYLWVEPFTEAEEYPDNYPYSNYSTARLYDSLPEEERIDEFTACGDEHICLSTSGDGTARPWAMVANGKFFFLVIYTNDTAIPEDNSFKCYSALFCGDTEFPDGINERKVCCLAGSFYGELLVTTPDGQYKNERGFHFGNINSLEYGQSTFKWCMDTGNDFFDATNTPAMIEVPSSCGKYLGSGALGKGKADRYSDFPITETYEYNKDVGIAAFRPVLQEKIYPEVGPFRLAGVIFRGFLPACYSPLYQVIFKPLEEVEIGGEGFVTMSWGVGELLFKLAV